MGNPDEGSSSIEEQFESLKSEFDVVKNLLNHIVMVLGQNKIYNKVPIPTIEEVQEALDNDSGDTEEN